MAKINLLSDQNTESEEKSSDPKDEKGGSR